jgi:ABC-type branched-subunit amino acid transport system permease subunit
VASYLVAVCCQVGFFACAGLASGWLLRSLGLTPLVGGALMGSGAYAYALTLRYGLASPWAALAVAAISGGCLGYAVVAARHRVAGADFAMVTFCAQVVWHSLVANLTPVTGGALGLGGLATINVAGLGRVPASLALITVIFVITAVVMRRAGRGWFAVSTSVVASSLPTRWACGADTSKSRTVPSTGWCWAPPAR